MKEKTKKLGHNSKKMVIKKNNRIFQDYEGSIDYLRNKNML